MAWAALPPGVQVAIVEQVGTLRDVEMMPGAPEGFTAQLYGAVDDVFVKAIPTSSPYAIQHKRERWAAQHLDLSAPTPRMLWQLDLEGYHLTAWELINDHARHADLRRGSRPRGLEDVLQAIAELGKLGTPCPDGARSVVNYVSGMVPKVRKMLDLPASHLFGRDLYATALNGFVIDRLRGNAMLHCCLSDRHLLIKDHMVFVVGWSEVCSGEAWIDPALFAPYLIRDEHTPEEVNAMLWGVPAWRDAPRDLVAGLTAMWTLFHLYKGHHTEKRIEESVGLADAGREWLAYLLTRP
ncbi:hypothetical protein [Nonomuraea sp. NPDC048916]|uniref:hypothetical protein n=1 Tax=Nonomuraea sp. NPDC048916 TaxID=3154232 RepID=UPI003403FC52